MSTSWYDTVDDPWINREAYKKGAILAKHRRYEPERAAFIADLATPMWDIRPSDMVYVEDFLHGYYGAVIDRYRDNAKADETRIKELEKELDAAKSREARPLVSITTTRKDRGRSGRDSGRVKPSPAGRSNRRRSR